MENKPESFSELYDRLVAARRKVKEKIPDNDCLLSAGYRGVPFEGIYPADYSDATIGLLLSSDKINDIISSIDKNYDDQKDLTRVDGSINTHRDWEIDNATKPPQLANASVLTEQVRDFTLIEMKKGILPCNITSSSTVGISTSVCIAPDLLSSDTDKHDVDRQKQIKSLTHLSAACSKGQVKPILTIDSFCPSPYELEQRKQNYMFGHQVIPLDVTDAVEIDIKLDIKTNPLITAGNFPKTTKEEIDMNVENFDKHHYYPTGYSGDPNISQLKKLKDVYNHYAVEKSDEIVGCAILCRATVSDDFNTEPAAYFSPYAKSHDSLRREVYSQASIRLEIPDDCFARKGGYIHGFYTKSGYFLDRVEAMVFMTLYGHKIHEERNVSSRYGLTSDNIWPKELRLAVKDASAVPAKPIPKTVSQMMKEKKDAKLKKKLSRRF